MFDIGWSELLVIGIVALIAIGPKELPGALRALGQWTTKIRRMASEFQGQFQEAMREAEMADLQEAGRYAHLRLRSDRDRAQGHRKRDGGQGRSQPGGANGRGWEGSPRIERERSAGRDHGRSRCRCPQRCPRHRPERGMGAGRVRC